MIRFGCTHFFSHLSMYLYVHRLLFINVLVFYFKTFVWHQLFDWMLLHRTFALFRRVWKCNRYKSVNIVIGHRAMHFPFIPQAKKIINHEINIAHMFIVINNMAVLTGRNISSSSVYVRT